MKVDFKPQRLLNALVLEEKIPGGVRRILQTDGAHPRTIDMELRNIDSLGNVYPKEYYVSYFKAYDTKSSRLTKMLTREVTGSTNSVSTLVTKNKFDEKYSITIITRNNDKIQKK